MTSSANTTGSLCIEMALWPVHTSVNMRDLPVPELWTTEMALA